MQWRAAQLVKKRQLGDSHILNKMHWGASPIHKKCSKEHLLSWSKYNGEISLILKKMQWWGSSLLQQIQWRDAAVSLFPPTENTMEWFSLPKENAMARFFTAKENIMGNSPLVKENTMGGSSLLEEYFLILKKNQLGNPPLLTKIQLSNSIPCKNNMIERFSPPTQNAMGSLSMPLPSKEHAVRDIFPPEANTMERFLSSYRKCNEEHLPSWSKYNGEMQRLVSSLLQKTQWSDSPFLKKTRRGDALLLKKIQWEDLLSKGHARRIFSPPTARAVGKFFSPNENTVVQILPL